MPTIGRDSTIYQTHLKELVKSVAVDPSLLGKSNAKATMKAYNESRHCKIELPTYSNCFSLWFSSGFYIRPNKDRCPKLKMLIEEMGGRDETHRLYYSSK